MSTSDQAKLKKRIVEIQRQFPQLILQVVLHSFRWNTRSRCMSSGSSTPETFAGDSRRGKDNHSLLIVLDPVRNEAGIIPGYGLESFLKTETLDHLLELRRPCMAGITMDGRILARPRRTG